MNLKNRIQPWIQSDWLLAFFLLIIFLAVKGYKFGWDDQHLEIPLLKSLIDKALYPGDYYVESLKVNFVSFFYLVLARLITVKQIPAAYFALYLISKYFLFFWAYKLWYCISRQKSTAFLCVAVFILFGRVPEFLYRTFSHQEFCLAIVVGGIYFFYRERFILASAFFGFAANTHALYSLIPMTYLSVYLLLNRKKHGWKTLAKSIFSFAVFSLPVLVWIGKRSLPHYFGQENEPPANWIPLFKLACPQNFIFFGITFKYMLTNFKAWLSVMLEYFLLAALYFLNALHNEAFKKNFKNHAIALTALGLLVFTYIFTYVTPTRLVLDLNLVRNTQFLYFLFMGYTTLLIIKLIDREKMFIAFYSAVAFGLLVLNDYFAIVAIIFLTLLLSWQAVRTRNKTLLREILIVAIFAGLIGCIVTIAVLVFKSFKPDATVRIIIGIIFLLSALSFTLIQIAIKFRKSTLWVRRLFIILPLLTLFSYHVYYHLSRIALETKGGGFWKLQRDWEDMQTYVRANTPKDAILLVPNDMEMGGFRILSERTIICCYRDCGIVGFDYKAAVEWYRRLHDIEPFKVILEGDIQPAIVNAIFKYKANYIVFMHYYAPKTAAANVYQKIYENDSFSLFKLNLNLPNRPA